MMINLTRAAAVGAATIGLLLGASGQAFAAAPVPAAVSAGAAGTQACQPAGTQYNTSQSVSYIANGTSRIYGSAGGTLTIAAGTSKTISGSLQTTASAEAGVVFAKASVSVGVTIGLSKTVTTTNSYSWVVPANQNPGWIELGSAGYQISWTKGTWQSPCTWVQTGSGSILGATSNQYFTHS